MSWYLLSVYLHILATVLWVGYALFWTIMIGSLRKSFDAKESTRLVNLVNQALWPPEPVPAPYRVKFPGIGWAALFVLVVTGISTLYFQSVTLDQVISRDLFLSPFGWTLAAKLIFVLALLICQFLLSYRPAPGVIYLNASLSLVVVSLSTRLVH
jgi:hypothetical protein